MSDFVFVISPGRSGTAFCAALFGASCRASTGESTVVRHEPLPVCAGAAMRLFNAGRVDEMQRLAVAKWRAVQAARPAGATYVETNAQFIKAFGWCLPADCDASSIGVLELHRDAERVAASFVANGEAPLFTAFGDVWNLAPGAAAALTLPPTELSPRAAIAWQIAEIAARAAELRARCPAFRWHSASLDELSTVDGATAALAAFGLRPRDAASLAAVLADTAVNSGAERAHAALGVNDAEAVRVRPPRQWPHARMADNVAHVERLVDALLAPPGVAERIRAHTRPLLGIGASCMVGAKRELTDPALAFSELHFQLICSLCARVAPDDVLFSFVRRVGGAWQLCDRINSVDEPPPVAALPPVSSARFVVVVVGATGRLAPFVLTELLHWFATLRRPVTVRLVARAASLARARGVAADLHDTNDAVDLAIETFSDEQLAAALLDADLTLLMASAARQRFDERHDLAARNTPLYEQLADALAPGRCRIVVVANPTMMLAGVLCRRQPSLQSRVTALVQCDAQRAAAWVAARLGVAPRAVVNVLAVGNHSLNVHIDTSTAFVRVPGGGACLLDDCLTPHELGVELPQFVHQRGRELIALTGHTALLSVARCVVRHAQHLFGGGDDELLSAGVFVDTRRWRAQAVFDVPSCLPRRAFGFADVWPLEGDFVGFLGMPVRSGGAVDWMAWIAALQAPAARVRLAASVRELTELPVALPALLIDELTRARAALHSADCVLVLAGAGLSADVIPDLLSFERQFAACVARGDRTIFHVSNYMHFESAPTSAWGFFASRALSYGSAPLSPATETLARWLLARAPATWFVETSNLDGQLRRAGVLENVFERHGTLFDVQCTRCDAPVERREVDWFETLQIDAATLLVPEHRVPRCSACGAVQRIATALAVDPVPFRKQLQREQRERRDAFARAFMSAPLSVVLEIGVGVQMPKLRTRAAALKMARRGLGQRTVHVRVNKLHHAHTGAPHADDLEIALDAGSALSHLCANEE